MRDRLFVARELLTTSGSILVQISEDNVHLVRTILDEVFGARNYMGQIASPKRLVCGQSKDWQRASITLSGMHAMLSNAKLTEYLKTRIRLRWFHEY
jgi:hypothetical protein